MAEERRNIGQPPRHDQTDESPYPPVPSEDDDRARAIPYHSRPQMSAGAVRLPSIMDGPGAYGPPAGRTWDPRATGYGPSPNSTNGYPPPPAPSHALQSASYSPSGPGNAFPPPGANHPSYLPPVHAPTPDPRASYPPGPRTPSYFQGYGGNQSVYDFAYRQDRGASGTYTGEYARGGPGAAAVMQQSAPRQRTSIACRYCRRRKIRCSGYQNSPGGKCTNCIKMNQECVFQPVSSSSSTAFVPVSALPNGVPPGTQLFGAYGQPLVVPSNPNPGSYQTANPQYDQPLPSPTGSYGSFSDERPEQSRRRPRPPEDEHTVRLPPPATFPDDNPRRRSPSSGGSPSHLQPLAQRQPQPVPYAGYDTRTPPPRGSPSGAPAGPPSFPVMRVENIIESGPTPTPTSSNDFDRKMISRLDRQTQQ
ncbi:hypothetical protein GGS23DRAFT_189679 [Durotheca rogersii]|uniref:uncharacterized protein n=1 Tax=Durotheca rogersii TaxID=419775 RepID=UPI00222070B0|nr:uncharacterized protein GGS23DRAFT_189679 [Durotheca rogersii]KAI5867695.1 hypothetical protein GGS23DRAFT_189679 [Durotheca rogersii]